MQILTGANIANKVDYSFGDHAVMWDWHFKEERVRMANASNIEFLEKAKEFQGKIMTLFIDNIRLYPREVKTDTDNDRAYVNNMMMENNLLALCSLLPYNGFTIFTGQEDTPIDEKIILPFNVNRIYAVNAIYNTDRVIPFPFGLQRNMGNDKRLEIMEDNIGKLIEPSKLLYINCAVERHQERKPLANFTTNDWVTTRFDKDSKFFPYHKYQDFLDELRNHKFIACPKGHGMDTHRIWETLYMRRVPIIIDHQYFRRLLDGFPVLFITNWTELTPQLLESNKHLYEQAQNMDLDKLNLEKIFDRCLKGEYN